MKPLLAAFGAAIGWHLLFGLLAPVFLVLALGLIVRGIVFPQRGDGKAWQVLAIVPIVATLLATLAVPLRAGIQVALTVFEAHGGVMDPLWRAVLINHWIDAYLGAAGVLLALVALSRLGATWTKLRNVADLPTSRARSVATGLVELEGTARVAVGQFGATSLTTSGPSVDWDAIIPPTAVLYKGSTPPVNGRNSTCEFLRAFFLEDATGRILVDPRGAKFGSFNTSYLFGEPPARLALSKERLLDGDPVYVVGAVRPRKDASPLATGSDRLVLSAVTDGRRLPLAASRWLGWLREAFSRRDVFLLSDTREVDVRRQLGRALLQAFMSELMLLAAALWLLLTHAPSLSR